MQTGLSRREFLTRKPRPAVMRPPHAVAEADFGALCDGCGACLDACPEAIIVIGADELPRLDLSYEGCTFCAACMDACPMGALDAGAARLWTWKADIGATCLSFIGITCRTCGDACEAEAIRFRLQPGGRDVPLLDHDACTGCGTCKAICPVDAVRMIEWGQEA